MRSRLLALCLVALGAVTLAGGAAVAVPSPDIVISQVYGGGGNTGSLYKNDFIELFNRGTTTVDVTGWSVQYTSSGGTTWQSTVLAGAVEPGQYYLVREAAGAGGTADLPQPDASGGILMSAIAGKVALVTSSAALTGACPLTSTKDLVGYGTANCSEGASAPGLSNPTSDARAGEGCIDSDSNATDFQTRTPPTPRNSASPRNTTCGGPRVVATVPTSNQSEVPRESNISIIFSEPVTASPTAFALSCAGAAVTLTDLTPAEPTTTFVLDPAGDLPQGVTCTFTVEGSEVVDATGDNPADYSSSFTTVGFRVRIHDIQDSAHLSPYENKLVTLVPGIVTVRRSNGFYMQDPQPDSLAASSEGIFVFTNSAPPPAATIGAPVAVSGLVQEFRPGCAAPCTAARSGFANLTTTQISSPVVVTGTTLGTIAPTTVGLGGRTPPTLVIEDDAAGDVETSNAEFDPAEDGIDFYESLEAMLVRVNDPVAVGPTVVFGSGSSENREIPVLADDGAGAGLRTPRGGIVVRPIDATAPYDYQQGDFNPERIILGDLLRSTRFPLVDVSDRLSPYVDAVVDYSFANYKFLVLNEPSVVDGGLQREVAEAPRRNELAVATINVENLDGVDPQSRFDAFAKEIDDNLRLPDLIAVEEIQDNDGPPVGPSNSELTWTRLIQAILAESGVRYEYRQIDPVPCTTRSPQTGTNQNPDGGEPCGNIRVGFLFRTDRGLAFVDRPGGTAVTPNQVVEGPRGQPQLLYSPGRIDPNNPAFIASRKPLAAEFTWRGRTFFAIANHFNSKGGDDPLFGRFQPPIRRTEVQRQQQATIVHDFVEEILRYDGDARVIVLGDLNDFWFSETLGIVEGEELVNLARFLPLNERYSYVFDGNSQTLDHIVVSRSLLRGSVGRLFDYVHVNSEFADQISDHDPPLARLLVGGLGDEDAPRGGG